MAANPTIDSKPPAKGRAAARARAWAGSLSTLEQLAVASIAAGVVIRALWVFVFHQPLDHVYSDMYGYTERGLRLAAGGPMIRFDASYPPGTHMLMALPALVFGVHGPQHAAADVLVADNRTALWGAAVLWWLMSSVTPIFMWRFARLVLTPAAAALTAIFVALWPLHIMYAGYFLSDTPSTMFLVLALWLAARAVVRPGRGAVVAALLGGMAGGAALINRPQLALNLLVVAVPMLLNRRRQLRMLVAFSVGVVALALVAIVHNTIAAGRLTAINENSGQVFWQGQCNVNFVYYGSRENPSYVFADPAATQRGGGEDYVWVGIDPWDQSFFYKRAFECIRDDGLWHVRILLRNIADETATTVPWPQVEEPETRDVANMVNVFYSIALPVILFQSFLLIRRRRRDGQRSGELLMLLHLACGFVTAMIYLGEPRYRIPYDVFGLALLAALLADAFFDRREPRSERAREPDLAPAPAEA